MGRPFKAKYLEMSDFEGSGPDSSVDTGSAFPNLPQTFLTAVEDVIPREVVELPKLLEQLSDRVGQTPETSWFLVNVDPPVPRWELRPSSLKEREFELATYLWDIHSEMSGHYLHILWRTDQLSRSAVRAFTSWELIPAAALARALLETAAVFTIEHQLLLDLWADAKQAGFR